MSYLHCHGSMPDGTECGWGQDDFWELVDKYDNTKSGYSPLSDSTVEYLRETLFKDKVYMDSNFFDETKMPFNVDKDGPYCTGQEYVAWEFERKARSVRNMICRTWEEFLLVKDTLKCPSCGGQDWDID